MVSSLQIPFSSMFTDTHFQRKDASANLLTKSLFPSLGTTTLRTGPRYRPCSGCNGKICVFQASLIESPVLWAGRVCIYYALLKVGLAGSQSNPLISETGNDVPFSTWLDNFMGKSEDDEANRRRKLVSKWHPTTKGTLKRSYRVPSKLVGQRLLKAIASLLSEDDHFVDASSHKGCQIRRESAHGETVCCNNVRALFDELPTPHLVVEITAFPAGSLTDKDYAKAEKLEKVLRSGASI